jgi:hypothetical protein
MTLCDYTITSTLAKVLISETTYDATVVNKHRYFNNLIKKNRYLDSFSVSAKPKFTENCFVFKPQCKSVTLYAKCTKKLLPNLQPATLLNLVAVPASEDITAGSDEKFGR